MVRADAVRLESAHGPQPGFEPTMVGLDHVVCILLGDMPSCWYELVEHPRVDRRLVDDNLDRQRPDPQRAGEEPSC
jgi:hypothetical protein